MCRQALVEYEQRFNQPMRLILSGQQGEVMVIASAKDILPFGFTAEDMK
jgi:cytidine deaminase